MVYVKELELRYRRRRIDTDGPVGLSIRDSLTIYLLFHYLQDVPQEKFLVVHLDTKRKVQSFREVSAGTLTSSVVDPAEVFRGALLAGVKCIIGVHNHPSGDLTPSLQDKELTERLRKAGEVVGVTLLDHVIIGEGCFTASNQRWRRDWAPRKGDGA